MMNETDDPIFHPRRHQARPCRDVIAVPREPDIVDQTTARLAALNETLQVLAVDAANPFLQSKQERVDRRKLRADVYAEIARLVGPEERLEIVKRMNDPATPRAPIAFDHAQERRANES